MQNGSITGCTASVSRRSTILLNCISSLSFAYLEVPAQAAAEPVLLATPFAGIFGLVGVGLNVRAKAISRRERLGKFRGAERTLELLVLADARIFCGICHFVCPRCFEGRVQ